MNAEQTETTAELRSDKQEPPSDWKSWKPSNGLGFFYLGFATAFTAAAIGISLLPHIGFWLLGQWLLAIALIQWFALLHEAGHKTLFATPSLNKWSAHLAGWMALIPGDCWRIVHAKHHYWAGWQDLDMTTETLTPRRLRWVERIVINVCWRLWIPLFASLYRVNNYWNLPRLWKLFPRGRERRMITTNIIIYAITYAAAFGVIGACAGWLTLAKAVGLGLLLSLAMQDLLILSQHTHIPMTLSHGEDVAPYPPLDQGVFTRSLLFPAWFARLVLLNMDAHALHHMYPKVPGYYLHALKIPTENCIPWWEWVVRAKSVSGEVLLFHNRDETGYRF